MIEIFTDGSSRNGHGGWGWIATFKERKLASGQGKEEKVTHQAMEITAVIKALEVFEICDIDITIYSDSAYVVNCINDRWYDNWRKNGWMTKAGTEVKNMLLWEKLISLIEGMKPTKVKFRHVRAHQKSNNKYSFFNNIADELASRRKKG